MTAEYMWRGKAKKHKHLFFEKANCPFKEPECEEVVVIPNTEYTQMKNVLIDMDLHKIENVKLKETIDCLRNYVSDSMDKEISIVQKKAAVLDGLTQELKSSSSGSIFFEMWDKKYSYYPDAAEYLYDEIDRRMKGGE